MSGIRINASRMFPLKVKASIIQPRLRVRILPEDSNVESSNMACLPEVAIQPRRPGVRSLSRTQEGRPLCARVLARGAGLKALRHPSDEVGALWASPGTPVFRSSQSEPLYLCRHRAGENCSRTRPGHGPCGTFQEDRQRVGVKRNGASAAADAPSHVCLSMIIPAASTCPC